MFRKATEQVFVCFQVLIWVSAQQTICIEQGDKQDNQNANNKNVSKGHKTLNENKPKSKEPDSRLHERQPEETPTAYPRDRSLSAAGRPPAIREKSVVAVRHLTYLNLRRG